MNNGICDSCANAVHDEAGGELDPDSTALIATELGRDIADHLCDDTENGETVRKCLCACGDRRRAAGPVR